LDLRRGALHGQPTRKTRLNDSLRRLYQEFLESLYFMSADGCEHARCEKEAPEYTLLVYVDDANGRLKTLRLDLAELTFADFAATGTYPERFGKAVAFCSDLGSAFRVSPSRGEPNEERGEQLTRRRHTPEQIIRRLREADSELAEG